jgi:hypothetical protein
MTRGTSKPLNIQITDGDGDAYTLATGERLLFGVRPAESDTAVIIKEAAADGAGGYTVELKPSDTEGLEPGRYVYDVNLERGEDFIPVIDPSPFDVKQGATKWGDRE